jgi:hypothetical protein
MCVCLSVNMLDAFLPIPDILPLPNRYQSQSRVSCVTRIMRHPRRVCVCVRARARVCVCEYAGRPSTYPRRSVTRRVSCVTRIKCHPRRVCVCVCL